jgi:hypothetical protein
MRTHPARHFRLAQPLREQLRRPHAPPLQCGEVSAYPCWKSHSSNLTQNTQEGLDDGLLASRFGGESSKRFRRTAVRNLEHAGVSLSAATIMIGHRSESIYQGIALTDEVVLDESAAKLTAIHRSEKSRSDLLTFPRERVV